MRRWALGLFLAAAYAGGCSVAPSPEIPASTGSLSPTRPAVTPTPATSFTPVPTLGPPGIYTACGRLTRADCEAAIQSVRVFAPEALAGAEVIVVEWMCGPGEWCAYDDGPVVVVAPCDRPNQRWRAFEVPLFRAPAELPYPRLRPHILELLPDYLRS
jgi:hypothetical protein